MRGTPSFSIESLEWKQILCIPANPMVLLDVRLLTADEYHRMIEAGIVEVSERVELLEGQLIKMAAKGTAHAAATARIAKLLEKLLGERAWIRVQDPVQLDEYSEPEPDLAIAHLNALEYADHHPTASEIYGLIEVADTTLQKDCEVKSKLYAKAGIREYWVLDVQKRQLYVFRKPEPTHYTDVVMLDEDASMSLLAFPEISLAVKDLLPLVKI